MLASVRQLTCLILLCASAAAWGQGGSEIPPVDVSIEDFLPVITERMTVGSFEPESRSTGVSRPFFLVGCDDYSLKWVERHRLRLLELGAFGLVVDVPDIDAYRRLEEAAGGLIVRPVAGDLIAEHLELKHYPALVTADGVFP